MPGLTDSLSDTSAGSNVLLISGHPDRHIFAHTFHYFKAIHYREFPGGPVVRTPFCHCQVPGFKPWLGYLRSYKPHSGA